MQVPAYWPVEVGVQCVEYKGVFVEVKNVMTMEEEEEPMPDMEEEEEEEGGEAEVVEAMDMADMEDMFDSSVGYQIPKGSMIRLCWTMEDIVCSLIQICADDEFIIMSDG